MASLQLVFSLVARGALAADSTIKRCNLCNSCNPFNRSTASPLHFLPHPLQRFLSIAQGAFQLPRFHGFEDFAELRAGLETERDQVVAPDEWRRDNRFVGKFFLFANEKLVVVEHPVAAETIDPVELELIGKMRASHETFEPGDAHSRDIFENHVLLDRFDSGFDFRARKTEPMHHRVGHGGAEFVVTAKTDPAGFIHTRGRRFADIVKEHAENERD